jgi:hypothetical protein
MKTKQNYVKEIIRRKLGTDKTRDIRQEEVW